MIDPVVIQKIQQLLDIGGLSHRKIAKKMGVGRTIVDNVSSGKRQVGKCKSGSMITSPGRCAGRCPICGVKVQAPCLACQLRLLKKTDRE